MTAAFPVRRSRWPSRWIVAMCALSLGEDVRPRLRAVRVERAGEADAAGADELLQPVRADELLERVDVLGRAGQLEDDRVAPEVGDARREDLAERHQLGALRRGRGDLHERQLPLDRRAARELGGAEDVAELVQLLLDLLEAVPSAVDAERDPADVGALGRADG